MKKIKNWFIGDYLLRTDDVFEKARIQLILNFALFFLVQAVLLYGIVIANHLWYHFVLITGGWFSMFALLYVLKVKQNARLCAKIWIVQFLIIGTGSMIIEGGATDMMSGFWLMVQMLFAFFTLEGIWLWVAVVHGILQMVLGIVNTLSFHGKLFEIGISADMRLPANPFIMVIPFSLCIYIIIEFVRTGRAAEKLNQVQKVLLQQKNKEITDSIAYAEHIQSTILPSDSMIKNLLPNSFVAYLPKDIVSGDFYWIAEKNEKIYFAVCDCTGHGVPGAIMSVIAQNILNRILFTSGNVSPAQLLDKASELMEATLANDKNKLRDGMDIALCVYDPKTNTLEYAGANNPLYVLSQKELKEFKANKQPIGRFENKVAFKNNEVKLAKGDSVYIFSDGIADQFGGKDGKKFKYKRLKELLLKINSKNIEEQKHEIVSTVIDWRGELEQIDDVCIFGVQF